MNSKELITKAKQLILSKENIDYCDLHYNNELSFEILSGMVNELDEDSFVLDYANQFITHLNTRPETYNKEDEIKSCKNHSHILDFIAGIYRNNFRFDCLASINSCTFFYVKYQINTFDEYHAATFYEFLSRYICFKSEPSFQLEKDKHFFANIFKQILYIPTSFNMIMYYFKEKLNIHSFTFSEFCKIIQEPTLDGLPENTNDYFFLSRLTNSILEYYEK